MYLYSKTGQMKRALYLIIDRLGDVSQAIAFAKEQGDPDLWEDLLDYSMDKPRFIRGLLEEVGTAIDPITLVRRIPEGLEVAGLREGLKHIMKEHEIQYSISSGVARVLRSEVAAAQNLLRDGQRKGIKFELVIEEQELHADGTKEPKGKGDTQGVAEAETGEAGPGTADGEADGRESHKPKPAAAPRKWQPGHCAQCLGPFTEWEAETLVGFMCGHVFHLAHLMEKLHPGEPVDADLLAGGVVGDAPARGYHVGPKVTRARLLRDRIRGGCPACARKASIQ